jgi:hypothetical protein
MSVQGKSKGKKQSSSSKWTAKKIGIVVIGVGFVIIMIVSSLGMGWLTTMKPAQTGDNVYVGMTFYDGMDRTVLTTNQRIFNTSTEKGEVVWWVPSYMGFRVNTTTAKEINPVTVFNYFYGEANYALFAPEVNQISEEVLGMKEGETRKVVLVQQPGYQREMTVEEFEGIGGNFTRAQVGEQIILAFTMEPSISVEDNNSTQQYVIRTGYVTAKGDEGVIVNYGYPRVDVSLVSIGAA